MSGGRELGETLLCMQCHGIMERRSLPSPTSLHHRLYRWWCLSHLFFGPCQVFSLAPRVDGARGGDGVLETHPTPLARCSASRLGGAAAVEASKRRSRNENSQSRRAFTRAWPYKYPRGGPAQEGFPKAPLSHPISSSTPFVLPLVSQASNKPPASIESTHTAKESTAIMSDSKNFETLQLHAGYVLPQARGNSFN